MTTKSEYDTKSNGGSSSPSTTKAEATRSSADTVADAAGTVREAAMSARDTAATKLPEMTAEGKRLSALMKSSWALPGETQAWDSYLDFDSWDRCITRGMPSSMMPYRYNNGVRIVQVPGYVILDLEMVHESEAK